MVATLLSDLVSSNEVKQAQAVHALVDMARMPRKDEVSACTKFLELDGFATLLRFLHVKLLALPTGGQGDPQLYQLAASCVEAMAALVRDSKANR